MSTLPSSAGQSNGEGWKIKAYSNDEESEDLSRPVYEKSAVNMYSPGEMGKAVHLTLNAEEKKQEEDSIERYAINVYTSDKISLHRHIKDDRMYE